MKIIVCGTMVPVKYETQIKYLSNAANRFLHNFCEELRKEENILCCSYIAVNVDEKVKKEILSENTDDCFVFKSKGVIGSIWKFHRLIREKLKKADCLLTYNVTYAWMLASYIARLKKKKSVLILADYSPSKSYKSKLFQFYAAMQLHIIRKYDYVVGLSEYTKRYLCNNQEFVCIEGGISKEFYDYFEKVDRGSSYTDKSVVFMYSGLLSEVTGVDLLVRAFKTISSKRCQLIISGRGSMETYIQEVARTVENINYIGLLPYDCYMKKLKQADILINPRNMFLPENSNNFPSKVLEYIATGKPILSTRFPGNDKFKDNIVFCESTIKDLADKMERMLQYTISEYEECYARNRIFAKEFLWQTQIEKILKLVKE